MRAGESCGPTFCPYPLSPSCSSKQSSEADAVGQEQSWTGATRWLLEPRPQLGASKLGVLAEKGILCELLGVRVPKPMFSTFNLYPSSLLPTSYLSLHASPLFHYLFINLSPIPCFYLSSTLSALCPPPLSIALLPSFLFPSLPPNSALSVLFPSLFPTFYIFFLHPFIPLSPYTYSLLRPWP